MKYFVLFALACSSLFAMAQNPCDDLVINSVKYNPFTDTTIIISVENNTPVLFDYPGFVLINAAGDTVAKEQVNYFGIGQESIHTLQVFAGVQDPSDNFVGDMELHTGFYDTLYCSWPMDQSLCSASPCDSLILGFQNWGGALVTGDFAWSVQDDEGALVDSGSFTMVVENQYWFYGLCLEPGNYTYSLTALTPPSGGGPTLTVSPSTTFASPTMSMALDWFNQVSTDLTFPFYIFCAESPSSITNNARNMNLKFLRNGGIITVQASTQITELELFGMDGKLLHTEVVNAQQVDLPTSLSAGLYIVKVATTEGVLSSKVYVQ